MAENTKKLIKQSKDTTFLIGVGRRRSAVEKLGKIGTGEVVIPLVQALEDEDKDVKRLAFQGLASLKDPLAKEVLRNLYVKKRKKVLWQLIKKNNYFPDNLAEKLDFLVKARATKEVENIVTENNFEKILDLVIESEMENPVEVLKLVIEKGGEEVEMNVIKKFISSKNDVLFRLIDYKEWYPPQLDKKIMFLLKTERYEKVSQMLDDVDFREVLNILTNPRFPMKKQASEALSLVDNPIIIDEICRVFLKENLEHLTSLIKKNTWSPNHPREKIFFYIKTGFLEDFLVNINIDAKMIGGYLDVPHVKKVTKLQDLNPLANYLDAVAISIKTGEKLESDADNPLAAIRTKANEYMEHPKSNDIIKEICDDFLEKRSPYLGHLIVHMGWAPEEADEKTKFYLLSNQPDKVVKMGEEAVQTLYENIVSNDEQLKTKAEEVFRNFKNPKAIDKAFRIYFSTLDHQIEAIIKEKNWKPHDKTEKALYFIFSKQLDRYTEVEPDGFDILFDGYKTLDSVQRFKLIDILIKYKGERFVDFLLKLFSYEKNPRVLKLLCTILPVFFDKVNEPLQEMAKTMQGNVLKEVVIALKELETKDSLNMLYKIGCVKSGYTCLWILKLLEQARWQPEDKRERAFFYDLFKIRDGMIRTLQNKIVDEDSTIRETAAFAFSDMGDERELTTLMKYVEDPSDNVRAAIAYSIGKLCALSPNDAIQQIDNFRIGSIYMIFNDVKKAFLVGSDIEQVAILGRNYQIGNLVLRIFSIAVLEGLQKREGIPTLISAINDPKPLIRITALKALRDLSDRESEKPLLELVEDDDEETRIIVAEALGSMAGEESVEHVLARINTGEYSHSDGLVLTLGKLNPHEHRELFERIVNRPDFSFEGKKAAIQSLGLTKDDKAAHFLLSSLRNVTAVISREEDLIPYIDALGAIGTNIAYQEMAKLLITGTWKVRKAIIKAFGNIPERITLVNIIKALEDPNPWIQMEAIDALTRYTNHYFEFRDTKKDLQFVGAIIARLKKFKLNEFADKRADEYGLLIELSAMLLRYRFTKLYLSKKPKIIDEG
ncbi:MAG: HEAT repeat domain-containing protein [Candidatus Eremiobacteraeota bacterium]|nr:HEAT repeat domain-containing protein [Candidatus Eremiobacteraeota bacterium]